MPLLVLGLNHTTAPLELRERVMFEPNGLAQALGELSALDGVDEAAIVSTCNRTELYCALDSPERSSEPIIAWLHRWHGTDPARITPCLYEHRDIATVRHLLRVASGLDSMVLGEPQIAGQLKDAWRSAIAHERLGVELGKLFQHAFAVAKQVRTETAIGASPVSVAFAATTLARQIFGNLGQRRALLIGAGETIELAARHLHGAGLQHLTVVNRDRERADNVAAAFGGDGVGLAQIPEALQHADIVVSSTASTLPILGKGAVEQALKRRRHRPMFMVDIAVPRDIEPEIGRLRDVFLYTVDDLRGVIEQNMAARRAAAAQAEDIIERQVEIFLAWQRSLDSVTTIKAFRSRAEAKRVRTLDQARQMLRQGHDPDEALTYLARTLTRRLIHEPTVALRRAGRDERTEMIDAARTLLGLDEST